MAGRFDFWRYQQDRLARELRDLPFLLFRSTFQLDVHERHDGLRPPH
jgi:hypothetical protein